MLLRRSRGADLAAPHQGQGLLPVAATVLTPACRRWAAHPLSMGVALPSVLRHRSPRQDARLGKSVPFRPPRARLAMQVANSLSSYSYYVPGTFWP